MEILLAFLILALSVISVWLLYENKIEIQKLHKRIDSIFTVDLPSPNEASKANTDHVELNEQNIIPADVGFEIEGKDENIPPGYSTKN